MNLAAPAAPLAPADLLAQVTTSWRGLRGRALHGPGCSCCGPGAIVLDTVAIADGIRHALLQSYQTQPALAQMLTAYLGPPEHDMIDPSGRGTDFLPRLARLSADPNATQAATILADIHAILRGIRSPGFSATAA